ncbi:transposase family protein [Paracraurococcus ruber]|uniref:transposase family protein n=1 Tax=Paracraurococcus ruber TaxID=77675 RepID=UPI0013054301|nr:transposase family protein [Paracraurococcus ruber]
MVDTIEAGTDRIIISAHPAVTMSACPTCGELSRRVHSRYQRHLLDLPSHGRAVVLHLQARRFRCITAECPRRTFAEPLPAEVGRRSGQRTARLDGLVQHLGIALGGRPGAGLAGRLMLLVSRDTLLRVVRRLAPGEAGPVQVIGIDEWAVRVVANPPPLEC